MLSTEQDKATSYSTNERQAHTRVRIFLRMHARLRNIVPADRECTAVDHTEPRNKSCVFRKKSNRHIRITLHSQQAAHSTFTSARRNNFDPNVNKSQPGAVLVYRVRFSLFQLITCLFAFFFSFSPQNKSFREFDSGSVRSPSRIPYFLERGARGTGGPVVIKP